MVERLGGYGYTRDELEEAARAVAEAAVERELALRKLGEGSPQLAHARRQTGALMVAEGLLARALRELRVVYFDMDNVLADFNSGISKLAPETRAEYEGRIEDSPGIFGLMDPMPGAVEAVRRIAEKYDTYILSTSPWDNPAALQDKLVWVKRHFGGGARGAFYKRVVFSHHKDLNAGGYLIDDRRKHGAAEFRGELIQFGSDRFPDWASVVRYLLDAQARQGAR
jgi:5'(3')-deoxyribonucleotidase